VGLRDRTASDASEAGLAVLERQLATAEPARRGRKPRTYSRSTRNTAWAHPKRRRLARRLGLKIY